MGSVNSNSVLNAIAVEPPQPLGDTNRGSAAHHVPYTAGPEGLPGRPGDALGAFLPGIQTKNTRSGPAPEVRDARYAIVYSSKMISSFSVACPDDFEFRAGPCHLAGKHW